MPDLFSQYEKKHLAAIARLNRQIRKVYEDAITEIQVTLSTVTYKDKLFKLSDYPALQKRVNSVIRQMQASIFAGVLNGIDKAWNLSNEKNDIFVDRRLVGLKPTDKAKKVLYDANLGALEKFKARKTGGLGLSDRIWNVLGPFEKEIEQTLGIGLGQGRPARDIAKDLKRYLREPDKLFRRVRGEDGKLYLSKAAREYHPGQGVYRSSYKNALRVSRTETNMAYRGADHLRWSRLPFVTGLEIKLSAAHPKFDMCDPLAGTYPKDFNWSGWHPQCLCYKVPKTVSPEEFRKMQAAVLRGEQPPDPAGTVKEMPANFWKWYLDNQDKISKYKSAPYWLRDNRERITTGRAPAPEPVVEPAPAPALAPAPIGPTPAGRVISEQFTKIDKTIKDAVDYALEAIDSVHGDGTLDDIPILSAKSKKWHGLFRHYQGGKAIDIKIAKEAADPEATFVHELGHYLDYYRIGNPASFASQFLGSASGKVVAEARKSEGIKGLAQTLKKGTINESGTETELNTSYKKFIKYLLLDEEIFARAYAQYIAQKSGKSKLVSAIKSRVADPRISGLSTQWTEEDFKPISEAIDKMLETLGWVSP